jgi:hypothetical protein
MYVARRLNMKSGSGRRFIFPQASEVLRPRLSCGAGHNKSGCRGPIQSLAPSKSHVSLLWFGTGFDHPLGILKNISMMHPFKHAVASLNRASPV